jgi:hypothetical protein
MQLPRIDAHLSPSHFLTLSLSHLLSPLPRAFGALRSRLGRAPLALVFWEGGGNIKNMQGARDEQENLSRRPWFAGNGLSGHGAWPCVFYRSLVTGH